MQSRHSIRNLPRVQLGSSDHSPQCVQFDSAELGRMRKLTDLLMFIGWS